MKKKPQHHILLTFIIVSLTLFAGILNGAEKFTAPDLLKIKSCGEAQISPNGLWIAYTIRVPRKAHEKPGGSYTELYLVSSRSGKMRPFITGKKNIRSIQWKPDGSAITFLTRRGDKAKTQVWQIALSGGEATQLTDQTNGIGAYAWFPGGKQIAYTATTQASKREEYLAKKGYKFIFYEENLKHRNLYLLNLMSKKTTQLTKGKTVWSFVINKSGSTIAVAASAKNLVDHRYMFQKIYLVDVATQKMEQLTNNPGKLGSYAFSPDGSLLTYTAALDRKDHQTSQVYVINTKTRALKNLTIPKFRGHLYWARFKDNKTILYQAGEGTVSTLNLVAAAGGKRSIIYSSAKTGLAFRNASFSKDFKHVAFVGSTPTIPGDLFLWKIGKQPRRITTVNSWLAQRELGRQQVISYKARDGWDIEGLLIYPVKYKEGDRYPLVVQVHGGPESHYLNTWVTRYSNPGQVLAGRGYVVFYPNYRASTGYGYKFALAGYEDAAGKEFDDIADGIDFLVKKGIADKDRVGLGGGSYGGFAAAWFSSYYTKYVKAVTMFVGISDLISKRGTTDIPYEELYVHSGRLLEKMWQDSLKRSPIYWAHQSKTAVLILGGTNDTRVHPSQSLEYYRRLKMNQHPAVRLVQYPGEGHGNRRQPGQIDALYRILNWFDWYVKDKNPLDGTLPPLDISDKYGLKFKDK